MPPDRRIGLCARPVEFVGRQNQQINRERKQGFAIQGHCGFPHGKKDVVLSPVLLIGMAIIWETKGGCDGPRSRVTRAEFLASTILVRGRPRLGRARRIPQFSIGCRV